MVEIKKEDITPVCPHCEKKIETLVEVRRGMFSISRVFCCPRCHKIVGMTSRH